MLADQFKIKVWFIRQSRDSCLLMKKTAEQIVYLNNHKQMYRNEQQFSISCLGSV